ncbi:MAG: ACT domain-containing protein [Dermabacter sp.]|nr:ACT domain-containing protein [Dermabacter sp.]
MIAIMTVTGPDHTGIIAAVSTALAELGVNITNVSQTLMGDYFTMILQTEIDLERADITEVQAAMTRVGEKENLVIRVQSQAIFDAMTTV